MLTNAEALIIGGGLAGSMAALELARAGRHCILLEKSASPHHKVCGEFISSDTAHYLRRCGLDLQRMGAVVLRSLRFVTRGATVETSLPFQACSLTRCALDEALLQQAALAGVDVRRGCHVDAIQPGDKAWCAHLRNGDSAFSSSDVFLATGKHDLRRWPRPERSHQSLVAFKMYYRLSPVQVAALGDAIELILFPGGYAGLQPVEGGVVNLCLLITATRLREVGGKWHQLESYLRQNVVHLNTRLEDSVSLLDNPLAASHLPYGHMQRSAPDGIWHLGDQAAVIPSFCGDGMAIALHSGALAAQYFLSKRSSETYRRQLHAHLKLRITLATRMSQTLIAVPRAAEIVRLAPGVITSIARLTRIPDTALMRERH